MGVRNFHWDDVNDCVPEETDGSGATLVTYTHEPAPYGPLLSEFRTSTTSTHHYDALGSTQFLTNDGGTVTDTFAYDAWGNSVASIGTTPTPYQWVGRWGYQHDQPTGGYSVRARNYQPTIVRWTSVDPLWPNDVSVPYKLLGSQPILLVDASGLTWKRTSQNIWESDRSGDSLQNLAILVSQDAADWVCIWPIPGTGWRIELEDLSISYPNTFAPCARADVSNLTADQGRIEAIMVAKQDNRGLLGGPDYFLIALAKVIVPNMKWTTGRLAANHLKRISQQGKVPFRRLLVGGHGAAGDVRICDVDGTRCFTADDVLSQADEPDNTTNHLFHAEDKIGPPRCWFTRNARIYGAACHSRPA